MLELIKSREKELLGLVLCALFAAHFLGREWDRNLVRNFTRISAVNDWFASASGKDRGGQSYLYRNYSSSDNVTPLVDFTSCQNLNLSSSWGVHSHEVKVFNDLLRPGQRVFVVAPKGGLGNSLRGFMSSWTYSLLSGRLVTLISSNSSNPEEMLFQHLCSAYDCGVNVLALPSGGRLEKLVTPTPKRPPDPPDHHSSGILESLAWPDPVMFSDSFAFWDSYWVRNKTARACVFEATGCDSERCVHARAMRHLLGRGPTRALVRTARAVLQCTPMRQPQNLSLREPPSAGQTVESLPPLPAPHRQGKGAKWASRDDVRRVRFDFALHVRTLAAAVEVRGQGQRAEDCEKDDFLCRSQWQLAKRMTATWLNESTWRCLGRILEGQGTLLTLNTTNGDDDKGKAGRRVRETTALEDEGYREGGELEGGAGVGVGEGESSGGMGRLRLFLATDNERLRGDFVSRLSEWGDVWWSRGGVVHLQKGRGDPLATLAEFFFLSRADVVVTMSAFPSSFSESAAILGNSKFLHFTVKHSGACAFNANTL